MNLVKLKHRIVCQTVGVVIACGIFLVACGGGGSSSSDETAGIGGTGIVVGKLTNFGSVFVNGGRFDTDMSQFIVDDDVATQGDLAIGMVVKVKVKTLDGVFTETAIEVEYDDEVQGPVISISTPGPGDVQRTFDIFGQTVTIDETGTIFEGTTFVDLDDGDVVEVSGFSVSPTEINATYIRKTDDLDPGVSKVELRGNIDQYTGGSTFEIDGTVINVGGGTVIDPPGGILANGLSVEVEGIIQANLSVNADEIEFEEEGFDEDIDEISLQGVISNYISDADFEIDGQAIDANAAQFSPVGATLSNGLEVEVEGDIVAGVLVADELEVREGEVEVLAQVNPGSISPANNRFEIFYPVVTGTVVVQVDAQTLFKDEAGVNPLEDLSIDDLMDNDFVKIEGREVNDEVVASIVKRIDPDNYKLEGSVDSFEFASWIQILGIRYSVNGGTEYEDNTLTAAQFFGMLNPAGGDLVEIEDDLAVPDGFADEVEFD